MLSTSDILALPDSPQKRAMLAQLKVPTPDATPVPLRKPAKVKGVMNKTEEAYALVLEARKVAGEIEWYGYEARTLELEAKPKASFTPDFWVILPGGAHEFHEVKRRNVWQQDLVKFKWAASRYPYARFLMVGRDNCHSDWRTIRDIPAREPAKGGAR